MRKLDDNFIKALNEGILKPILTFVLDNKDKIYCGIRNNEFHIYYRGGVLGKIRQKDGKRNNDINKGKNNNYVYGYSFDKNYYEHLTEKIEIRNLPNNTIQTSDDSERLVSFWDNVLIGVIDKFLLDKRNRNDTLERQAQHLLAVNNENNPDSNSYCIDIEYEQSPEDTEKKVFGKSDMILVSKNKFDSNGIINKKGKYRVVIIELKYGHGCYIHDPKNRQELLNNTEIEGYDISNNTNESFGSGIVGHFADFYRLIKTKKNYNIFKKDIVNIFNQKKSLNLIDNEEELKEELIDDKLEYWIITLCNNEEKYHETKLRFNSCNNALMNAIKRNDFSVQKVFSKSNYNELKDKNIKFYFYRGKEIQKLENQKYRLDYLNINDVIDKTNYESIDKDVIFCE